MQTSMSDSVEVQESQESQDTVSEDQAKRREIKSFVLRAGRMTTGQQRGLDECWDKWGMTIAQGTLDPDQNLWS